VITHHHVREGIRRIRNLFRTFAYSGVNVLCLSCGWEGKKFFSERCPRCDSPPRTRLVPYALGHFSLELEGGVLLHVGPNRQEVANLSRTLRPRIYYRLDLLPGPQINIVGSLTSLPFSDSSLQFIVLWHVMEHVSEDISAIREMHRVLGNHGQMLVSVPIYPPDRISTFEDPSIPRTEFLKLHGHPDHCRSCGLDYIARFESNGFHTKKLVVRDLPPAERLRFGLKQEHVAWLCIKRI
jgi:SAM-dependent methyltransferase